MKIYLKQNADPYRVSAPRLIPLRFQEPANSQIARYVKSGIIIPCDDPTDWCSPAFFVPKGDGKHVRLVTDYTRLNKFVVRPVHPFPSVSDIMQSIPASSTCFAKLDATHGYFQIPLDEEASPPFSFHRGDIVTYGRQWDCPLHPMNGVAILIAWLRDSRGAKRLSMTS